MSALCATVVGSCNAEHFDRAESETVEVEIGPAERASFRFRARANGRDEPLETKVGIIIDELHLSGTLDILVSCGGAGGIVTLIGGDKLADSSPAVAVEVSNDLPLDVDCTAVFTAGDTNPEPLQIAWVAELELYYAGNAPEPELSVELDAD